MLICDGAVLSISPAALSRRSRPLRDAHPRCWEGVAPRYAPHDGLPRWSPRNGVAPRDGLPVVSPRDGLPRDVLSPPCSPPCSP